MPNLKESSWKSDRYTDTTITIRNERLDKLWTEKNIQQHMPYFRSIHKEVDLMAKEEQNRRKTHTEARESLRYKKVCIENGYNRKLEQRIMLMDESELQRLRELTKETDRKRKKMKEKEIKRKKWKPNDSQRNT